MAEKEKPKKKTTFESVADLVRRLAPGQLGKDLAEKVTEKMNEATGQDK